LQVKHAVFLNKIVESILFEIVFLKNSGNLKKFYIFKIAGGTFQKMYDTGQIKILPKRLTTYLEIVHFETAKSDGPE